MEASTLLSLIERQRPGWSLEQAFYLDEQIYAVERARWMPRQWMLIAHDSELPEKGSRIVRDLFGESIIVVRNGPEDIRAYFNVCRHRGSRICKEDGRGSLLVCPYHAWSFKLSGELHHRRDVPEGVDPETLGLHNVPIHVAQGLIFCALPGPDLPDPAPALTELAPALRKQGVATARIAARKIYPTHANWKLVLENAFECYHCRNAHPEYTSVNGHVQATGTRDPAKAKAWSDECERWSATIDSTEPANVAVGQAGSLDTLAHRALRQPIGGGRHSLSRGGAPVSKLMGDFADYDGGETQIRLGRLSFASCANDYVTLVQIQPRGAQETDVVLTWLVDAEAAADIAIEPIQWMWDVTTAQDKRLIEDNASGIRSCAYRPGPYTALEGGTAAFVDTYLSEMAQLMRMP